jgi:hypothetical protein
MVKKTIKATRLNMKTRALKYAAMPAKRRIAASFIDKSPIVQ